MNQNQLGDMLFQTWLLSRLGEREGWVSFCCAVFRGSEVDVFCCRWRSLRLPVRVLLAVDFLSALRSSESLN